MRRQSVLNGDDGVVLAPDEHERDVLGEVEAVAGVDALAQRIHDRAQRVHERRPGLRILERGMAARQFCEIGAGVDSQPPEQPPDRAAGVQHAGTGQHRQHDLRQRQRGRAQQQAQVPAQAAAVHQHQALAALRELVGQLHRDPATQRVAHEGRALMAERHHQVPHAAGMGAQRVVTARLRGLAVSDQVRRYDGEAGGQVRQDSLPRGRRRGDPVHEHDRRPTAGYSGRPRGVRAARAPSARIPRPEAAERRLRPFGWLCGSCPEPTLSEDLPAPSGVFATASCP